MDISTMFVTFLAVIGEAMGYSFIVFKKSVQNEGDSWDPTKAGRTIAIALGMGLLAALIAGMTGWPMEDVTSWGTATGLFAWFTIVIDQAYSYATGPKGKADREKLEKEIEEDVENLIPIIEKASKKKKKKAKEEEKDELPKEEKKVEEKDEKKDEEE